MTETTNLELKKPEKTNFVSIGDFNLNSDKIDKLGAPEFDDSGVVDGITDFTTYLSTLVSGSSIFNFFRNLKAGFQYVLHVGQLVNNTVTNNDNLPASASAVYKLQQSLNITNSNLSGIKQTGVFDLENPPNTTIFVAQAGSTNMPALGGNACIVFQLLTANDQYKAMFAFGFGSDKIAINRKNGSSTWTGWKYITLS